LQTSAFTLYTGMHLCPFTKLIVKINKLMKVNFVIDFNDKLLLKLKLTIKLIHTINKMIKWFLKL